MSTVTIQPVPKDSPADLPLLTVDMTVDSSSPALAASVALLVKMGAPQPIFIDQKIAVPQTGTWYPNNLTVFMGTVGGEPKQVVDSSALVAAFPYQTFNRLAVVGLVTPNINTPQGVVLDHFSSEPPMLYDPHKLPGGTKNPGDFSQPPKSGSQGIFGGD